MSSFPAARTIRAASSMIDWSASGPGEILECPNATAAAVGAYGSRRL